MDQQSNFRSISIHLRQNYEFLNRKFKRCAIWTVCLIWNECLKSFLRLQPFAFSVKKKKIKSACCLRYDILTHSILTHILHVKVSSMPCSGCKVPFLSVQEKKINYTCHITTSKTWSKTIFNNKTIPIICQLCDSNYKSCWP